jgi:DNA-binding response OmpR family regulator
LLREMLNELNCAKFALTHFGCMLQAVNRLAANAADIILLDPGLPDAQGRGAVRWARAAAPLILLIVLTGSDDEWLADQALQEASKKTRQSTSLS